MKYEDFVIQIGPEGHEGYSVSVVKSPAGEGFGFLKLPFSDNDLGKVLSSLARSVETSRSDVEDAHEDRDLGHASPTGKRITPRDVGSALFRSLFSGKILSLYDQSVGSTCNHPGTGLRIQLKLNPEHPDLARLYSLPWEFLYRPDTQDFLSLSRVTPVVRYLDVSRPTSPFPLPSPLRILVVIASPAGLAPLDLRRERHNIENAWGRHKNVEVAFLQEATLGALREELLEKSFHVLHFMGHGGFDERSGEGVLFFESSDGGRQPISGQILASKLKDFKSLRLVFLNACNTAKVDRAGVNPFAGVASALVLGGIPAVVAMQFLISDQAAITFSRAFYQRLAAGDPVDSAVAEGRQAVHSEDVASAEWATPVLFLRTPDGMLFSRDAAPERPVGAQTKPLNSTSPPLLRMASVPQKPSSGWKKTVSGVIGASVIVALIAVAVQKGIFNSLEPLSDSQQNEGSTSAASPVGIADPGASTGGAQPQTHLSSPQKSAAPLFIKPPEPTPAQVLEINQSFRSNSEGFYGAISKVEIRGDRMRWYFHFFNQSNRDIYCGFAYANTYLADESGNRYEVLEAEGAFDVAQDYEWLVQKGVRLDRWFEFAAPRAGTKNFTVGLVSASQYRNPMFSTFGVSLPL